MGLNIPEGPHHYTCHIELLGHRVRDRVTGFKGVVTSVSYDLYGCVQVVITPEAVDGRDYPSGHWFDVSRIEKQIATVGDIDTVDGETVGLLKEVELPPVMRPDFTSYRNPHGPEEKPLP